MEHSQTFGQTAVILKQGDITDEDTDAIVNAANSGLMGGGGVDGAIHRAGGTEILKECQEIRKQPKYQHGLPTGEAVVTTAGNMKAKHVIHTVGPRGSNPNRKELLHNAYTNSLRAARDNDLKTIAFPSISTGIYGYPIPEAAEIALKAVKQFVEKHPELTEVRFVLFSEQDFNFYQNALKQL